eukprot:GEMP01039015.1.p1 GENE.GEMP01039015.1~~GEMP01039015.1.p1  ORF type:complete len:547 (+),score=129.91 GEMP01039015.1:173-1813(+)
MRCCPISGANCLTSTVLCGYVCCKCCQVSKVRNGFVFSPPPPSYKVIRSSTSSAENANGPSRLEYTVPELTKSGLYSEAARLAGLYRTQTAIGETIVLAHLPPFTRRTYEEAMTVKRPFVIHCHGNSTDIGRMLPYYVDLATMLNVDVLGVEYTGYGVSSGKPHFRAVEEDILAAYNFAVDTLHVDPKNIILYGESVGNGPVMNLATKKTVAGAVLHSPMETAIRVVDPDREKWCAPSSVFSCVDIFPNNKLVAQTKCDLLLIHGQSDEIIPFEHAQALLTQFNNTFVKGDGEQQRSMATFFPKQSGHNDILATERDGYYVALYEFMRALYKGREADAQFDTCIAADLEKPSVNDNSAVDAQKGAPAQMEMTPAPAPVQMETVQVPPAAQMGMPPRPARVNKKPKQVRPPAQMGMSQGPASAEMEMISEPRLSRKNIMMEAKSTMTQSTLASEGDAEHPPRELAAPRPRTRHPSSPRRRNGGPANPRRNRPPTPNRPRVKLPDADQTPRQSFIDPAFMPVGFNTVGPTDGRYQRLRRSKMSKRRDE